MFFGVFVPAIVYSLSLIMTLKLFPVEGKVSIMFIEQIDHSLSYNLIGCNLMIIINLGQVEEREREANFLTYLEKSGQLSQALLF